MKNNPDWEPYFEAVVAVGVYGSQALVDFLNSYPKRLRPVVALGLSLAKWYLFSVDTACCLCGVSSCGCCVLYGADCEKCPLCRGSYKCIHGSSLEDTYNQILGVYTEYFNALPEQDRQRLVA